MKKVSSPALCPAPSRHAPCSVCVVGVDRWRRACHVNAARNQVDWPVKLVKQHDNERVPDLSV